MENREIKIKDKWYSIGDLLEIEEQMTFLFWTLPFKVKKVYQVYFIGKDSTGLLTRPKDFSLNKVIVGEVRGVEYDEPQEENYQIENNVGIGTYSMK